MNNSKKSKDELILELNELQKKYDRLRELKEGTEVFNQTIPKLNPPPGDEWKIHALFDKGPMAVAYHVMVNDENGQPVDYFFLDANDQYIELTGVDPRGKNATEAFPGLENDPADWIGTFGEVARTGKSIRFEQYLQPNGRCYDCLAFQYKPDHFVAAFFEITQRKIAEQALQKIETKQAKMLSNIGDVVFILDQNAITKYKSANLEKLFGWKPEELIGFSVWNIVHPDDRKQAQELIVSLADVPFKSGTCQCRYLCKDNNYKWIQVTVVNMLHDPDIKGFLGNYHDITERRQTEADLIGLKEKAEESDRLKSAFLANMSHEIRTPLNGIIGFLDLLEKPVFSEAQREQFAAHIRKSSDRLLTTINDIITISKVESGQIDLKPKNIDVHALMKHLYDEYHEKAISKGLTFNLSSDSEHLKSIYSDEAKLQTIFNKLVNNAIKFTDKGFIEIGVEKRDGHIVFYVADSGIGIPQELRSTVFGRFTQVNGGHEREYEGLGIGLFIASTYAEKLGAQLWVESEENKGSTFYFSINSEVATFVERDIPKEKSKAESVKKKEGLILIAEDDDISYIFLQEVLKKNGFRVIHAENGEEAVRMITENPDIDLILMDVKMPVMDGEEATRQIRKFNKTIPIIAQTAYEMPVQIEKMRSAGCDDVLIKPINGDRLLECLYENF